MPNGISLSASGPQEVTSNGVHVADAQITSQGVTITFNENVNGLQHVSGGAGFSVLASQSGSSTDEKQVIVVVGNQTRTVTIKPGSDTGVGDDSYGDKGGWTNEQGDDDEDYSYVEGTNVWEFRFNAEFESDDGSGPIVIVDTLPFYRNILWFNVL